MRTAALACLILLLAASCKTTGEQALPTTRPETTVRVRNNNWLDVTLYAVRDAQRFRLGIVSSGGTEVFVIPDYLLNASLRFMADPLGSTETIYSYEVSVFPGEQIDLVIPSR